MALAKYMVLSDRERQVAGGNADQFRVAQYTAPENTTIVSVMVELAFSAEPLEPTLGYEHANIGGIARLVVKRAGMTIPTLNRNPDDPDTGVPALTADWDALPPESGGTQGTLNDGDTGDTWAISPFALSASGSNDRPGYGGNDRVILAPKTKRTLRRGDALILETWYSNAGADQGVIQEIAVGTLFVQT